MKTVNDIDVSKIVKVGKPYKYDQLCSGGKATFYQVRVDYKSTKHDISFYNLNNAEWWIGQVSRHIKEREEQE